MRLLFSIQKGGATNADTSNRFTHLCWPWDVRRHRRMSLLAHYYTLNGIKSKTVGDGQHGTARFATEKEIKDTYTAVSYEPERWRRGEALPKEQGLVVGYKSAEQPSPRWWTAAISTV